MRNAQTYRRINAIDAQPGQLTAFGGFLWQIKSIQPTDVPRGHIAMHVVPAGDAEGRFNGFMLTQPGDSTMVVKAA